MGKLSIVFPQYPEELEHLRDEWNALAAHQRSPIHRFEWAQACMESLWTRDSGRLYLFLVRRDGRLVALAFMRSRKEFGAVYLEDLCSGKTTEAGDLLYESRADLNVLLRGILGYGIPFALNRVPMGSLVPEVLRENLLSPRQMRTRQKKNFPTIDLLKHPEGELNAGRRSDLRRMWRRAEQMGPVRFEISCPAVEDIPDLLKLAIEIESKSWKIDTPHALRRNPEVREFLARFLPRAAAVGILRVAFMWIDERPVAMQIAVVLGQGYWLLKIGYDAELGNVAPGQLLMRETIRTSLEEGCRTYELWGSAAEWTKMWTSQETASAQIVAYPVSLRSAWRLTVVMGMKLIETVTARWRKGK